MTDDVQPNFANPSVDTQSWYVAVHSRDVRQGRIASYTLLNRRVAIYRDHSGVVHALDARCPHLGADLGQACIVDDEVQCAFHHWRFGADGRCRFAPGRVNPPERQARVYPVQERWGLVWIFNGPHPLFPLPSPDAQKPYRVIVPTAQQINCHPHLVVGNGLDTRHLETLHGMRFTAPPQLCVTGNLEVTAIVKGRPNSRLIRWITGCSGSDIVARFSAIGGNLAWANILEPVNFHVLFTGQPGEQGGCKTQTIVFLPREVSVQPLKALALLYFLLHRDRRVLERLDFHPAYAADDEPLRILSDRVNRMPIW
jgi:nitrite reductase/ring-hydroxylating ferredoxin subunit